MEKILGRNYIKSMSADDQLRFAIATFYQWMYTFKRRNIDMSFRNYSMLYDEFCEISFKNAVELPVCYRVLVFFPQDPVSFQMYSLFFEKGFQSNQFFSASLDQNYCFLHARMYIDSCLSYSIPIKEVILVFLKIKGIRAFDLHSYIPGGTCDETGRFSSFEVVTIPDNTEWVSIPFEELDKTHVYRGVHVKEKWYSVIKKSSYNPQERQVIFTDTTKKWF